MNKKKEIDSGYSNRASTFFNNRPYFFYYHTLL